MKSLNVKKVILKNPHLRNLRKNLRIVLRLAIDDKIRRLDKLNKLYLEKSRQGKQVPSQKKREIQISRLSDKLMHLEERRSCITCNEPYCISHKDRPGKSTWFEQRTNDLDLVWIPWHEKWVCLDCYEEYHKDTTLEDYIDSLRYEYLVLFDDDGRIERGLRQRFKNTFVDNS